MVKEKYLFNQNEVEFEEDIETSEILDYSTVLSEIANTLYNYRKENNLTQKELSKELKMSQSMITKLERGNYNATFNMLLKISYKLEKSSHLFLKFLKNIINKLEYKEEYKKILSINHYNYKMNFDTQVYNFSEYKLNSENSNNEEIKYSAVI